jgi:acylphosphatase
VFFRAWTRDEAKRGGLNGWVRNCPDGSVEAHLEGELSAVRWLIDKMAYGPSGARVDNVEVREAKPEDLHAFVVEH